jgi:hypothetical protein
MHMGAYLKVETTGLAEGLDVDYWYKKIKDASV